MLAHTADILKKTTYRAPISGIVTYIAVRLGENVVPGIQNAYGSYLMTVSDMSEITAEVMVDETDIVNMKRSARRRHHRRHPRKSFLRPRHRGRHSSRPA